MFDTPLMQSPPDAEVRIDGRDYLYFGGTSYLALHARPEPAEAACRTIRTLGLHTATSRTGLGNSQPLVDLEREAAAFFATEAAICLPSGYLTAAALLQTLSGDFDTLLIDRASHYAVMDAARLVDLPAHAFATCDPTELERILHTLPADARPLLLTDGLFPLGRVAPLDRYRALLERFAGAAVLIDDAHGFGILGPNGRGLAEHLAPDLAINRAEPPADPPAVYVGGTLSKALGGYGGIIAGEEAFIDRLRRGSHLFAGASALPGPVAAASSTALRIARTEPQLRHNLHANVRHFRAALARSGLPVDTASPSPIIALELGSAAHMQQVHQSLRDRGILVPYLPTYTGIGPAGALRVAVFASHTTQMLDRLVDDLGRVV